jgi:hypothetical protein
MITSAVNVAGKRLARRPRLEAQQRDEIIHFRSVMLGSARYGITCKMDLVETAPDPEDLFNRLKACPVEYKVSTPQVGDDGVRI